MFLIQKKKEEEEEGFQILQKQSRLNDVNDTNFRNTILQYDKSEINIWFTYKKFKKCKKYMQTCNISVILQVTARALTILIKYFQ